MDSDVDNLLEFLLSKGQIPSFSFPLDTTVFAAESKSKRGKKHVVSHMARYSRDTKLAISELAPGQQRTVNGKKLEIGGLYFEYSRDPVNRASQFFSDFNLLSENRVSLCQNMHCGWISEDKISDLTETACPICLTSSDPELNKKNVKTYLMLKPEGFAPICVPHANGRPHHGLRVYNGTDYVRPISHKNTTKKSGRFSGRARLPAPDVNDISSGAPIWSGVNSWKGCNVFVAKDSTGGGLGTEFVLINTGPEEEGFEFCSSCGASMNPEHIQKFQYDHSRHFRPYIVQPKDYNSSGLSTEEKKKMEEGCPGVVATTSSNLPIALGLRFRTDIALFRFDLADQDGCNFDWTSPEFHGALMAFRDAIQTKLVEELGLMNREISAGYRLVSLDSNKFVDIFLYDSVSGGAGLVTQLEKITPNMEQFLDSTISHLDGRSCLENKACTRACVGCLLDFKNRIDHNVINRPLGWSIAQFFKDERIPSAIDFGLKPGGEVINRVDNALETYLTFMNDDSKSMVKKDPSGIILPSGEEWNLVSPFFKNRLDRKEMRIDYFELYPSEITDEFDVIGDEVNWSEFR
jgi:hypothetical protein